MTGIIYFYPVHIEIIQSLENMIRYLIVQKKLLMKKFDSEKKVFLEGKRSLYLKHWIRMKKLRIQ